MRRTRAILLALAISGVVAGCSASGGGRPPCPLGERCVNVAITSDPYTLDPNKYVLSVEAFIFGNLLVGLTAQDSRGRIIPGMATSWSTSADGLTWTFRLRDAKWSDGQPVIAADFVTSLRRHVDPKTASPWASPLYVIEGAEDAAAGKISPAAIGARAPDSRTVILKLRSPTPYLAELMAGFGLPVPTHALSKWGDAWAEPGKYVSNGPYLLETRAMGDRIVLTANPDYFGPQPCFDRVTMFVTPSAVTAERRVVAGEMDIAMRFETNRTSLLRRTMPGYVRTPPALGFTRVAFNLSVPALKDRRVRDALAMSIDREFLTGKLLGGGNVPLTTVSPIGVTGYSVNPPVWASWPLERRVETARKLMRAAGYTPARPLRLDYKYPASQPRNVAAFLQSEWRAIGAEISLSSVDPQIHFNDMMVRDFELGFDNFNAAWMDPSQFLELSRKTDPNNYPGYDNPAFDAALERANQQSDPARRLSMLANAEAIIAGDVVNASLYGYSPTQLVNPAIIGFDDNLMNAHPAQYWCRK